jgi:hypothetical protein
VRVELQTGGAAVVLVIYAVRTGVKKLCRSLESGSIGSSAYDDKESTAVGGIVESKETVLLAVIGVE